MTSRQRVATFAPPAVGIAVYIITILFHAIFYQEIKNARYDAGALGALSMKFGEEARIVIISEAIVHYCWMPLLGIAVGFILHFLVAENRSQSEESNDLSTQLKRLETLRSSGSLSETEFKAAKDKLLIQK